MDQLSAIDIAVFVFATVLAVGIVVAIVHAWWEALKR